MVRRLDRIRDGQGAGTASRAEIAKLYAAQKQLKGAYLTKAKAAVDANLAEHKK